MNKINNTNILLYVIYSSIVIIFINIPYSILNNEIVAILTLIISILSLYKTRDNILTFILFFFIFYVNYSVIIGEYLVVGNLSVPFDEVKNEMNYGINIKSLFFFSLTLLFFYKPIILKKEKLIKGQENALVFFLLLIILTLIGIFGVDRSISNSYIVKITSVYEYSKVLFIMLIYYSGQKKAYKYIAVLLCLIFVAQDFYYGGRITSIQLIIVFGLMLFSEKLTVLKIILYSLAGLVMGNLVNQYRSNYNILNIDIRTVFSGFKETYFVFDTATYAYYASATHIAAALNTNYENKIHSFIEFFKNLLFIPNDKSGELTTYVSENYYFNLGGGFITSHFYYWFGWIGVIFISLFIVTLINKLNKFDNEYYILMNILMISGVSRWYLYSPNQLFKGTLIIGVILIIVISFIKKIKK